MKHFLIFIVCVSTLLTACNQKQSIDYSLLEGDWVFTNLTINNDPMTPDSPWGIRPLSLRNLKTDSYDSIYKVINDTILFKIRNNRYEDKFSWHPKFTIKSLTKDSLTVYALRDSVEYTLYNSDLIKDTSIHVDRICYTTTPCYGSCPIFSLEINKDDSVYYDGRSHTKKKGLHTGIISPKTFAYFEELIQKADIEKLDSVYNYPVTDNQACCINIYYNNGKIKSTYIYPVFKFDLPFINLLSDNLLDFDTYVPLTKSEKSYKFPHNRSPYNFQVPAIVETIKFTPPVVE